MILEPKITSNLKELESLNNALNSTDVICDFETKKQELYNVYKKEIEIRNSILKNIKFISCNFEKSYFVDAIFDSCDLSNMNLSTSTFKRVIFKDCKLTGTFLSKCYLENISFINCNAFNIYLDETSIFSSLLKETNFSYGNFSSMIHKYVEIDNVNFTLCNFSKTKLQGLNFSTSNIEGIITYTEDLKGAIMNESQALNFIKILGIKII